MKKTKLLIMLLGAAFVISSCSKEESLVPDSAQKDQATPAYKFNGIEYSGVSNPAPDGYFDPGTVDTLPNGNVWIKGMVAEWYDTADEPMLTGPSFWYENWKYNLYDPEVKFWGKAEVFVEGGEGVWEGTWHGYGTFLGVAPYNFWFSDLVGEIDVVFTGHGGEIEGMVAKVTYNIDTSEGFYWSFTGFYK